MNGGLSIGPAINWQPQQVVTLRLPNGRRDKCINTDTFFFFHCVSVPPALMLTTHHFGWSWWTLSDPNQYCALGQSGNGSATAIFVTTLVLCIDASHLPQWFSPLGFVLVFIFCIFSFLHLSFKLACVRISPSKWRLTDRMVTFHGCVSVWDWFWCESISGHHVHKLRSLCHVRNALKMLHYLFVWITATTIERTLPLDVVRTVDHFCFDETWLPISTHVNPGRLFLCLLSAGNRPP